MGSGLAPTLDLNVLLIAITLVCVCVVVVVVVGGAHLLGCQVGVSLEQHAHAVLVHKGEVAEELQRKGLNGNCLLRCRQHLRRGMEGGEGEADSK